MVGIENFYKGGIGFAIGIDDAAITLVVIASEEDIHFLNEFSHFGST